MKQFHVDIYLYGDGSENASSEPLKLITKDDISKEDLEKFRSELAENGLGDDIDWRGVEGGSYFHTIISRWSGLHGSKGRIGACR